MIMATSILLRRPCFLSKFSHRFIKRNFQKRHPLTSYYVLLPEVPPDTPETNPIMVTNDFLKYSKITPENTVTGCAKLSIDFETQLGDLIESLKDPNQKKTFSSVFDPIENITVPLNCAWRTSKNLNYLKGTEGFRQAFRRIHPQVEKAKNERWISETLHKAIKDINTDRGNLKAYQCRLIDLYLLEGKLNGVELSSEEKKKFTATLAKLSEAKSHFRNKIMICNNLFSHRLDDLGPISELPKHLLPLFATDRHNPTRGPWKVSLQPVVYGTFLEYCNDRMLRWNVWHAMNNRGSLVHNEQNLTNHKAIDEIRTHRRDLANMLGYESYAHMSMETKMAGSVERVLNMIESLKSKFKPAAEEELNTLQAYAESEGFRGPLEMWDIDYWRRRHRESLFRIQDDVVAQYFSFENVLGKLFKICEDLFAISFKECTSDVETWHPDVRLYKIFDANGEYLSAFYLDPYSRPREKITGSWVESGREKSDIFGTDPVSVWCLNLPRPIAGRSPLMTFSEVASMCRDSGHALQQLLTTVPYGELSGQRNVEWDAISVCANVMEQLLTSPEFLRNLSQHHETGEKMPMDMLNTLLDGKRHMVNYDMMRQLYFSAFDMEIYMSNENWFEIMKKIWNEYMLLPLDKEDFHPCSLVHIFSDQYPASYYSYKWSEMIAADIFTSFEEDGLDDISKIRDLGKRFRETFLSLGGAVPTNEIFRHFQGRDPSFHGIFRKYNHDGISD